VRFPNVYGIDMPATSELVAADRTEEEVAKLIGADRLIYQDLDDLVRACLHHDSNIQEFDDSCFSGRLRHWRRHAKLPRAAAGRALRRGQGTPQAAAPRLAEGNPRCVRESGGEHGLYADHSIFRRAAPADNHGSHELGRALEQHVSIVWPDAECRIHAPLQSGRLHSGFNAVGYDVVLLDDRIERGQGEKWLDNPSASQRLPADHLSRARRRSRASRHAVVQRARIDCLTRERIEHRRLADVPAQGHRCSGASSSRCGDRAGSGAVCRSSVR
jgi:hypothetical protein